jgi:hypothetical protein
MSSKAVIDVGSIVTSQQLRTALTFAGVDVDEAQSDKLLAVFRATNDPRAGETPSNQVEVGIWVGARTDRNHNPFRGNVRHVIGAWPSLDPELVRSTVEHLSGHDFITLDELMDGGPRETYSGRSFNDLKALTTLLDGFCMAHKVPQHVADALLQALDEGYLNAIYNGPAGHGPAIDRANMTPSEKPVSVTFAYDDTAAAVMIRDSYGSLTDEILIQSLARCYEQNLAQVQEKRGGAGIGMFMLMQAASRLVFNIDPGNCTEMIFVRDHRQSRRAFANTAPTLNICVRRPNG